jgi:hypothetical protein
MDAIDTMIHLFADCPAWVQMTATLLTGLTAGQITFLLMEMMNDGKEKQQEECSNADADSVCSDEDRSSEDQQGRDLARRSRCW